MRMSRVGPALEGCDRTRGHTFLTERRDEIRRDTANYFCQLPIQQYTDYDRTSNIQVTHIAGIGVFFGFPLTPANIHNHLEMTVKLAQVHNESLRRHEVPEIGQIYGSSDPTSPDDPDFYRCCIVDELSGKYFLVCFIDYGNTAEVQSAELFELPEGLRDFPVSCKLFLMDGLPLIVRGPNSGEEDIDKTFQAAIRWMANQLRDREVEVVPHGGHGRKASSGIPNLKNVTVTAFLGGSDINREFQRKWGKGLLGR